MKGRGRGKDMGEMLAVGGMRSHWIVMGGSQRTHGQLFNGGSSNQWNRKGKGDAKSIIWSKENPKWKAITPAFSRLSASPRIVFVYFGIFNPSHRHFAPGRTDCFVFILQRLTNNGSLLLPSRSWSIVYSCKNWNMNQNRFSNEPLNWIESV